MIGQQEDAAVAAVYPWSCGCTACTGRSNAGLTAPDTFDGRYAAGVQPSDVIGVPATSAADGDKGVRDYTALISGSSINGVVRQAAFITFSFPTAVPGYILPTTDVPKGALATFQAYNVTQQQLVRDALEQFSKVSGLVFLEVPEAQGDMVFMRFDFTYMPPPRVPGGFAFYPENGYINADSSDVYMHSYFKLEDKNQDGKDDRGPDTADGVGITLHEIGHALGLQHPHDGTPVLHKSLDNKTQTVMSYNWVDAQGKPSAGEQLGALDKAALQYLYGSKVMVDGVDYDWNETTYTLTQTGTDAADKVFGISANDVITGGNGDDYIFARGGSNTISGGAGNDDMRVALRAGDVQKIDGGEGAKDTLTIAIDDASPRYFSMADMEAAGGFVRDVETIAYTANGVTRAFELVGLNQKEEIRGGAGGDTLHGEGGDDHLIGFAGDDTLRGGAGRDTLDGYEGDDTLVGGAGADVLNGGERSDAGVDTFVYEALSESAQGSFDVINNFQVGIDRIDLSAFALTGLGFVSDGYSTTITGRDGSNFFKIKVNTSGVTIADVDVHAGTTFFDTRTGTVGSDEMQVGDGNDTLYGGAGTDTLRGLGGEDKLFGEDDNDTIDGGSGDDAITGGAGADTLTGGAGSDRFVYAAATDSQKGSGKFDEIVDFQRGDASNPGDKIDLSAFVLTGLQFEKLIGQVGDTPGDQHWGTAIVGRHGDTDFRLQVNTPGLTMADLIVAPGTTDGDILSGGAGKDDLKVGDGADTLYGEHGDDTLTGLGGDDRLVGGAGADSLTGGDGADHFVYAAATDSTKDEFDSIADFDRADLDKVDLSAFKLTGLSFEKLIGQVGDTPGDQHWGTAIVARSGSLEFRIQVGTPDLTIADLILHPDTVSSDIRTGTEAGETLTGGDGDDLIKGLGGQDTLNGGLGADTLIGGTGGDTINVGADEAADVVKYESVEDALSHDRDVIWQFDVARDTIDLSAFRLTSYELFTSGADSFIRGQANGRSLEIYVGRALLTEKNVVLHKDTTADSFFTGDDAGRQHYGYALRDTIDGAGGNDTLNGQGNDDTLIGGAGDDMLFGGADNDTLIGGAGADTLIGDGGADRFVFKAASDSTETATDFLQNGFESGVDKIVLEFGATGLEIDDKGWETIVTGQSGGGEFRLRINGGGLKATDFELVAGSSWASTAPVSGRVSDGYVVNATVFRDSNNNGLLDEGEDFGYTDDAGRFELPAGGTGPIRAFGGTNLDTGLPNLLTLSAPDGATQVDPLTSLVEALVHRGYGLDAAKARVAAALGLDPSIRLGETDLIAAATAGDAAALAAQKIAVSIASTAAVAGAGASAVVSAFATTMARADGRVDLVHEGTLRSVFTEAGLGSAAADAAQKAAAGNAAIARASDINELTQAQHRAALNGDAGDNVLVGGAGADLITGQGGDDWLDGRGGVDRLVGGEGDDTYVVDARGDRAVERAGGGGDLVLADTSYWLGDEVERLTLTGSGANKAVGNALDNVLTGNDADNRLNGRAGADRMIGGRGDDLYYVDDAGDVVVERLGEGADVVQAEVDFVLSDGVEILYLSGSARRGVGNEADNRLIGGDAGETLLGLDGADVISGKDGNDMLDGGAGADKLHGGLGQDTLTGGEGADVFVFANGSLGTAAGATDLITDFGAGGRDRIHLAGFDAVEGSAGMDRFRFIGADAFSGTAGELRYAASGGNTLVLGDTDGDGVADVALELVGVIALTGADFIGVVDGVAVV